MGYFKFGIVAFAIALFATPSVADAQNFQQLGTRRGALTGAILGAVIGDQNNEALGGAVIGGLVGGTIGNVGGRNLDRQFGGGAPIYNYRGYSGGGYYAPQQTFARPAYYGGGGFGPAVNVQYQRAAVPVRPVYGGFGGGYGGGGFYGGGRPSCGGRGW